MTRNFLAPGFSKHWNTDAFSLLSFITTYNVAQDFAEYISLIIMYY